MTGKQNEMSCAQAMIAAGHFLYESVWRQFYTERYLYVLSESLLYLPLRLIFCQSCTNFINVHAVYASKICTQLTKNHLAKTGTKRFREYIY